MALCQFACYAKCLLITTLFWATQAAIGVPLFPEDPRCFIETVYRDDETIKVHVKFPEFHGETPEDGYFILWRDLTNDTTIKTVRVDNNQWKEEFFPMKYHYYEFCYVLRTSKHIPKNSLVIFQMTVEFNIHPRHSVDGIQKSEVSQTASRASSILEIIKTITDFQQQRVKNEQVFFYEMHQKMSWIRIVSFMCFGCLMSAAGVLLFIIRREFTKY